MASEPVEPLLGERPGSPLGRGGDYRVASVSYAVLGAAHLVLALLFLAFPFQAALVWFGWHDPHSKLMEHYVLLIRLTSSLFLAGGAASFALKAAADSGSLLNPEAARVKAGLVTMAPLVLLLHLLYARYLTWWGLAVGGVAMVATMLVPIVTLGTADISMLGPGNMAQGVASGMRQLFYGRPTALRMLPSPLFALLTLLQFVAGVFYLLIPGRTLRAVLPAAAGAACSSPFLNPLDPLGFSSSHMPSGGAGGPLGHVSDISQLGLVLDPLSSSYDPLSSSNAIHHPAHEALFLWRILGAGLVTILPTITYVLKDATDNSYLTEPLPTTLTAGLVGTAAVHVAVLLAMQLGHAIRWLLLLLLIAWSLLLVAALGGTAVARSPTARTQLRYEPV